MSNYSQYLLIKQLDVTTDLEKAKKRFAPQYFHTILKEVEDANKRKNDIGPQLLEQLYRVMMARILQGSMLVPHMYNSKSWFKHNTLAVNRVVCLVSAYRISYNCLLHFDDWGLDENYYEWNEAFNFPKHDYDHDAHACSNCVKIGLIADKCVKRWQ